MDFIILSLFSASSHSNDKSSIIKQIIRKLKETAGSSDDQPYQFLTKTFHTFDRFNPIFSRNNNHTEGYTILNNMRQEILKEIYNLIFKLHPKNIYFFLEVTDKFVFYLFMIIIFFALIHYFYGYLSLIYDYILKKDDNFFRKINYLDNLFFLIYFLFLILFLFLIIFFNV